MERPPPIADDSKPVVLVCGENPQLYPAIALAYGNAASFANVTSYAELVHMFRQFGNRIKVVCMDVEKQVEPDADAFHQYILSHGSTARVIAVFREGNIEQLRKAVQMDVFDVISIPPQNDMIQRKLSRALMVQE